MTKKDFTYIGMVLDRSGSMENIRLDVVGGVNTFITEQKKVPGEAVMSLYQFDDQYQVDYESVDIQKVVLLTLETFVPRGWTALLDALGRTTINMGAAISKMKEEDRPDQVILAVFTDGAENKSAEFTAAKIREMLKHQQDVYKWKILFLGANIDAIGVGAGYGVKGMNFDPSKTGGMLRSMKAASAYVGASRLGNHVQANAIYDSASADDDAVLKNVRSFEDQIKSPSDKKADPTPDSPKTP